jgi:hypothetical protein
MQWAAINMAKHSGFTMVQLANKKIIDKCEELTFICDDS